MTSDSSTSTGNDATGDATSGTKSTVPAHRPIPWAVVVPVVLVGAVLLLVGLPLGAVLIVSSSGCCLVSGPEYLITFWASMIAGFLALFGLVVTGVSIITAFRTDSTARAEAQHVADKAARTYLKRYKENLFEEMAAARDCVKAKGSAVVAEIQAQEDAASRAIAGARDKTTAAATEAQTAIDEARDKTTDAATKAQTAIGAARDKTTDAATEAQTAIRGAGQQVERRRGEAIGAIDSAQQGVETAAREARDRIDRAGEPPQGGDESR